MLKLVILAISLIFSTTVSAADSNRIIRLEQDMRNLERQVDTLEREVRELRQRLRHGVQRDTGAADNEPLPSSDTWLSLERWKAVRLGSTEMEVIEALGPPTSMRVENGTRVLLYAMEIGSSGFLSGSITLKDREVTQISTPALK